jgi:glycosyltransferase involved in cell wall biosynthesis
MIRVGLNLLHARPEIGGGWNYIANVVKALGSLSDDCEFIAYCTRVSAEIVPNGPPFTVRVVDEIGSSQFKRIAYEQVVLPFIAYRQEVDCLHWFANNRSLIGLVPSVVTVHDFKFFERTSEEPFIKELYLRRMARFACRRADAVVAVSHTTAAAASRLFGVDQDHVFVVPNPIDNAFHPCAENEVIEFRRRFNIPPKFWVYIAHLYPHKNHGRLFAAYKRFRDSNPEPWPLVLRGDPKGNSDALMQAANSLGIADSLIWLPRLSTDDLVHLYSAATALIFPSLYEGGGIPVLEAMGCGCPVAASGISTTKEFAGDAVLEFNPNSVDAIAEAMCRFATDADLRKECARRGLVRAKQYSVQNAATQLLASYRGAIYKPSVETRNNSPRNSIDHSAFQ